MSSAERKIGQKSRCNSSRKELTNLFVKKCLPMLFNPSVSSSIYQFSLLTSIFQFSDSYGNLAKKNENVSWLKFSLIHFSSISQQKSVMAAITIHMFANSCLLKDRAIYVPFCAILFTILQYCVLRSTIRRSLLLVYLPSNIIRRQTGQEQLE